MTEQFLAQLLALCAFFAFPIIQYIFLRFSVSGEGKPELWYLPAYGFRLVMRNIPRKRTFYNVRYRTLVREWLPPCSGSSVGSWKDYVLSNESEFFLLPGSDQILLEFRLEKTDDECLSLIRTNKTGEEIDRSHLPRRAHLVADYEAMLQNWFHFDVRVSRRVKISGKDLEAALLQISTDNSEQRFDICKTTDVA